MGTQPYPGCVASNAPIDVDDPDSWPAPTRRCAAERAEQLEGTAEFTSDLAIRLIEEEDDLRSTLGHRKLVAYHCTRLLLSELAAIRGGGLRLLEQAAVDERLATAIESRSLPPAARAYAQAHNVYAVNTTARREHQICFVLGRSLLDAGCTPLLMYWGGEAMRGGPGDAPPLAEIGIPTIVVAQLDFNGSRQSVTRPALGKLFAGTLLGTQHHGANVFYRDPGGVPQVAQEELRRRAVALVGEGRSQTEVAGLLDVSRQSVSEWVRAYRLGGENALAARTRGRRAGEKTALCAVADRRSIECRRRSTGAAVPVVVIHVRRTIDSPSRNR